MLTPPREFVWRRRLEPRFFTAEDLGILTRGTGLHGPYWRGLLHGISQHQDRRAGDLMLTAQLMRARAGRDCILGVNDVLLGGALEPCALLEELERFI